MTYFLSLRWNSFWKESGCFNKSTGSKRWLWRVFSNPDILWFFDCHCSKFYLVKGQNLSHVFLLCRAHTGTVWEAQSSTGLCVFLQIFEHLGKENKSVAEIERPGWQWTKDRVALTEKMALPLLCTSSPPGGDPRTSSMHVGCHSRRMTSFSSTMPFPLLTLNCHTPHFSTSSISFQPGGLHCFVATHTHIHTHNQDIQSYMNTHLWFSSSCDLQSVGSCKASHHLRWAKKVSGYNSQKQHLNTNDGDYRCQLMDMSFTQKLKK